MATRKSSATSSLIETTDYSKTIITSLTTNNSNTNTTNNTITNDLKDPILQKGFEKALRDASKESNLDKKLNDIKSNYESNKYDELITRLRDAESKNEYLTNIIAQLFENKRG